ncbi:MAG: hypothetical protein NT027_19785 [Proteobacteria bacterium]|nr:hypothetical protein [Pseudomonadota bacterium]
MKLVFFLLSLAFSESIFAQSFSGPWVTILDNSAGRKPSYRNLKEFRPSKLSKLVQTGYRFADGLKCDFSYDPEGGVNPVGGGTWELELGGDQKFIYVPRLTVNCGYPGKTWLSTASLNCGPRNAETSEILEFSTKNPDAVLQVILKCGGRSFWGEE